MPVQISEAAEFLSSNLAAIQRLMSRAGIEGGALDFGWEIPTDSLIQCNRFPLSFLSLCQQAQLEIEVSVYLTEPSAEE